MRVSKNQYGYIISLFLLIASFIFLHVVKIDFYNTTFKSDSLSQAITFPYLDKNPPKKEKFVITTYFNHGDYSSNTLKIVPDDCVENIILNDKKVDISSYSRQQLCDYKSGFTIDVEQYLVNGNNRLTLMINDYGGARGVDINEIGGYESYIYFLILFIIFIYTYKFLLHLNIEKRVALFFLLGLMLKLYYLSYTEFDIRTYDVQGHIDYIKYIAENFKTPPVDACWQCYHQPLYYILSAIMYKIATFINIDFANISLQYFTLFLNSLFLIYSILIIKLFIKQKNILLLFSSFMIFFPSLTIHAARIGNDALFYLFHIMSIYYFLKWVASKEDKKFIYLALISTLLAILVKGNGILTFGIIGLSYLFIILKNKLFMNYLTTTIISIFSFILVLALNLGVNKVRDAKDFALVGNAQGLTHRLKIDSSVNSFTNVDLNTYLSNPYTNPWKDGFGRNHFWHFLLKTSLFGEFSYMKKLDSYAKIISFLYIFILFFVVLGFLLIKQKDIEKYIVLILNLFILIIGMIYLRVTVPFACSSDFRYIVPIIVSFVLFYSNLSTYLLNSDKVILKISVFGSLVLFLVFSILFFIILGL